MEIIKSITFYGGTSEPLRYIVGGTIKEIKRSGASSEFFIIYDDKKVVVGGLSFAYTVMNPEVKES